MFSAHTIEAGGSSQSPPSLCCTTSLYMSDYYVEMNLEVAFIQTQYLRISAHISAWCLPTSIEEPKCSQKVNSNNTRGKSSAITVPLSSPRRSDVLIVTSISSWQILASNSERTIETIQWVLLNTFFGTPPINRMWTDVWFWLTFSRHAKPAARTRESSRPHC